MLRVPRSAPALALFIVLCPLGVSSIRIGLHRIFKHRRDLAALHVVAFITGFPVLSTHLGHEKAPAAGLEILARYGRKDRLSSGRRQPAVRFRFLTSRIANRISLNERFRFG